VRRIEQRPRSRDLLASCSRQGSSSFRIQGREFAYAGSGKAAIAAILYFLRTRGVLLNKMEEILVPPWIGVAVYQQMTEFAFPCLAPTRNTKVMLVYHQYGFPQDMNRILDFALSSDTVVIEDCAHAVESEFQGRRVGTFGKFAVFSLSKFVYCHALGGVAYQDGDFGKFFGHLSRKSSRLLRLLINFFKFLDEMNLSRTPPVAPEIFKGFRRMAYSRYGESVAAGPSAIALWESKRAHEMSARKSLYSHLRDLVDKYGICDHLERDGVTPYVVPVLVNEEKAERLVTRLREAGFETGIYHFDVNRFMLEPSYRKTVLIPVNSDLSGQGMDHILDIIRRTL
jgi:hypothetical protein